MVVVAKRISNKKTFVLGCFGIVAGFFCGYYAAPTLMQVVGSYAVYPVLLVQHMCVEPLKQLFAHKRERLVLEDLVTHLQAEKEELNAKIIQMEASLDYTQETQELVAFKKRYACSSALLTQILMKHLSPQAHYMFVDAGSLKGVHKDMVAVYQTMLLGRVTDVYPNYSKITLITDHSCKVACYCAQTKASGIHGGLNQAGTTQLHHVSHLATLQEGDSVLSSGEGLIFPRGFGLGRVKAFQVNGLLYDVTVEPFCDVATLQHCYLLQKGSEFALTDPEPAVDMVSTSTANQQVMDMVPTTTEYRGVDRRRRE